MLHLPPSRVRRSLLVWIGLSLAGLAVIAIPDTGRPLIRLSESHGPSALETVGVILLLGGWGLFVGSLWRSRSLIRHRIWLGGLVAVGALLTGWSVLTDSGQWWMLGVAVLVAAQVGAARSVLTAPSNPARSPQR